MDIECPRPLKPIVGRMTSKESNLPPQKHYRRKMVGSMKRRAGHFMVWDDGTRSVTHLVFNDVNEWPMSAYGQKLLGKFVHYWSGREGSPNVKGTITAIGCERGLLVVSVKVR